MSNTPKKLSSSAEDYLEAVGVLCARHGQAQVSDVAEMLNVKKPSVTVAMRSLADLGLITYKPYQPIQLTEEGKIYARKVMNAHGVLLRFMQEAAGLSAERATQAACEMEHVLTADEVKEIENRLNHGYFEQAPAPKPSES